MADSCAKRCAIAQARRTVVLHRRRQKFCFDEAGWHASAPLGVCCCSPSFALAGPGEHSIQPTLWDASPGVVRSPACQASRFLSGFLIHTLTYVILLLPFPGVYGARRPRRKAADGTSHQQHCLRDSRDSQGRRRSRGASVDTALACARVAHSGDCLWSASRDYRRALRPHKWQDVGWTSSGQCAVVFGWCWATQ